MNQTKVLKKQIVLEGADWQPKVVGYGRMISSPITKNGWRIVPYNQDNSNIPYDALKRMQDLYKRDYKIVGLLIAHEIVEEPPVEVPQGDDSSDVLEGILKVAGIIIGGLLFLFVAAAVSVVCSGDPVLIAVLEDGRWVEVIRWWE